MSNTEMIVRSEADNYQPVMTVQQAIERRQMIAQYTAAVMVDGEDYGVIPGTGTKKVLLKPGAEKLVRIFGLTPRFTDVKCEEDWTGEAHGGEMFFGYTVKCSLFRNEIFMGDADGSCNSWEKKYRYGSKQRKCPVCGAEAIITGKKEYGGGFVCFDKKGGCKAKFGDNDTRITSQSVGQIADPDIADKCNTLRKMAEKRALVAACLIVVGASEFFTQDIETDQSAQQERQVRDVMAGKDPYARAAPPQRQEDAYEAEYVAKDQGGTVSESDPNAYKAPATLAEAKTAFRQAAAAIYPAMASPVDNPLKLLTKMVACINQDGSELEEIVKSLPHWVYAHYILFTFRQRCPEATTATILEAIKEKYRTDRPMTEWTDEMWKGLFAEETVTA